MKLKDIQANQGNIDLVLEVVEKDEPRTFEKFGKTGRVCNVKVRDASGAVKLTLWNDDVDKIKVGDKIHLQNGWCSEYKGEKQLSSGKFGKIEVVEGGQSQTFVTNDPEILQGQSSGNEEEYVDSEDLESFDDEEMVE